MLVASILLTLAFTAASLFLLHAKTNARKYAQRRCIMLLIATCLKMP